MAGFVLYQGFPLGAPIFTFLPLIYPASAFFQAKIKFFFVFFSIFFVFARFCPFSGLIFASETVKMGNDAVRRRIGPSE